MLAPLPSDQHYYLNIELVEGRQLMLDVFVAEGGNLYHFCIRLFEWIGPRNMKWAVLSDWTGEILEHYDPLKGWWKPGKEEPIA
jgi:hypothetical protein